MGEAQNQPFQLSFNPRLRIEFQGSRVTSDGGLLLVRELDERLGFSELIARHLTDPRGKNVQFPLADLVRQSVYRRLAGYEDVTDAEQLSDDPTFRLIGSESLWERGAALTSRVHSFETELLTEDKNLTGLAMLNRDFIARVEAMESPRRVVLDIDSTEVPVYGEQEHSAYNGHFETTCYHPLLLFNREGDCLAVKLRPGNVHTAEDWDRVLLPEIERQQKQGKDVVVRADAGFVKPELYEALEAHGVKYAIRIPSNDTLEQVVTELLRRPVGRPSHRPVVRYKNFRYQAASWKIARRVVAKVEFRYEETVPPCGLHRDNPRDGQPCGGALLQQARHGGAVDQGREGGGQADAAELPPVPGERSAVVAERDRLQPGEPLAAARAAEADRHVVAREPATAARENGWALGQARPVLLAAAGRRAPDAAVIRGGRAAPGGAIGARRVASVLVTVTLGPKGPKVAVSEKSDGRTSVTGRKGLGMVQMDFRGWTPGVGQPGDRTGPSWKRSSKTENGNSQPHEN